jgi:filamentous hemagglutinin family protein
MESFEMPKRPRPWIFMAIAAGLVANGAAAEIAFDGTTGPAITLVGPNFVIGAGQGMIKGRNLFHSFTTFDILAGQSATFTGPAGLKSVVSRVTGGNPSTVDGLLRSQVPGADFWFINPSGVTFGAGVSIDVPAAFHVGTADHIRFADDALFSATDPGTSTLTVAAPEAFGFLGKPQGSLTLTGATLALATGKTLSLVGGALTLKDTRLTAPGGTINLIAVASKGEFRPRTGKVTFVQGADIRIEDGSRIEASGNGGGSVRLRGGDIVIRNDSEIATDNAGAVDSKGGIDVTAETLQVRDGGEFRTSATAAGDAGSVTVHAGSVLVAGDGLFANIISKTDANASAGKAGDIRIVAGTLQLRDGGQVSSDTFGDGDAGSIRIEAGSLLLSGDGSAEFTGISAPTNSATLANAGEGGRIEIIADDILIRDNSEISSDTKGAGKAGSIFVAAGSLALVGDDSSDEFTGISTTSLHETMAAAGDAGTIEIAADDISIRDGSDISSDTFGAGNAGSITIETGTLAISGGNSTEFTGITTTTLSETLAAAGDAGTIDIVADDISITDSGQISTDTSGAGDAGSIAVQAHTITVSAVDPDDFTSIASVSTSESPGLAGTAGDITITAASLFINGGGSIETISLATDGGNITLHLTSLLALDSGSITTSVAGLSGDGGNIVIDPTFVVLRNGVIQANAVGGKGGNVTIVTDFLFADLASVIEATSELGIDGTVSVSSPSSDVTGSLVALQASFFDAGAELARGCATRPGGTQSSLARAVQGAVPANPGRPLLADYGDLSEATSAAEVGGAGVFAFDVVPTAPVPDPSGCGPA